MTKAREFSVGDVFQLMVRGQVVGVASIADSKRIKIKLLLSDQAALEFLDAGCVLELLCKPGKEFSVWRDDDDDDDDELEPEFDPDPTGPVLVDVE